MSEIMYIKNSKNRKIAVELNQVTMEKIVIISHGFLSSMRSPLLQSVSHSLQQKGYTTLLFDFTGCGESDDELLTIFQQVEDLKSVIAFAQKERFKAIFLFGHSLGGLISIQASRGCNIKAMALSAPVTYKNRYDLAERYSKEKLAELKDNNRMTFPSKSCTSGQVIVSGKLFEERSSVDQSKLLENFSIPLRIVHGDSDERVPLIDSQQAMALLPKNCTLTIIENATHSFDGFFDLLNRHVVEWFDKY